MNRWWLSDNVEHRVGNIDWGKHFAAIKSAATAIPERGIDRARDYRSYLDAE
jgi:hypothetical protein